MKENSIKNDISRHGITARIVIYFTVLVIVPYFILAISVYTVFQNYSVASVGETAQDSMMVIATQLKNTMKEYEDLSMSLYSSGAVEYLKKGEKLNADERSQIYTILNSMAGAYGVRGVYLQAEDVVYSGGHFNEIDTIMKPYQAEIEAAGGKCLWYPTTEIRGTATGNRYILARSLNSSTEKNVGILYIITDETMVETIFRQYTNPYVIRYLCDQDGKVLYSSDKAMFGKQMDFSVIDPNVLSSYHKLGSGIFNRQIMVSYKLMKYGWYSVGIFETRDILLYDLRLAYPFLLIALIYLLFLLVMLRVMKKYIFYPLHVLKDTLDHYAQGTLQKVKMEPVGIGEFYSLSEHFNSMSGRIEHLMEDFKAETEEKNRQKMLALTSQLTPHFIYNALNTIKWMAVLNRQENIQHLTESLIYVFMNAAKIDDENYTVADELALIENYAVIQKARFMNFNLVISHDEKCMECRIRKLLLQPIVENAIVHGLGRGKAPNSTIYVNVECKNNLEIIVRDEGVGFDVEQWRKHPDKNQEHTNIGIRNVEEIIALEYGAPYHLEIESIPGKGTTIRYILPVLLSPTEKQMRYRQTDPERKTDDSDDYCRR